MNLKKIINITFIHMILISGSVFAQDEMGNMDSMDTTVADSIADSAADSTADSTAATADAVVDSIVDTTADTMVDPMAAPTVNTDEQAAANISADPDANLSLEDLQAKLDTANQTLIQATSSQADAQKNLDTILSFYSEPANMATDSQTSVNDVATNYQNIITNNPLADVEEHQDFINNLQNINNNLQNAMQKVSNLQSFLQAKIDGAQQQKNQADEAVKNANNDITRLQALIDSKANSNP